MIVKQSFLTFRRHSCFYLVILFYFYQHTFQRIGMNKDQHQTLPRLAPENCVLLICDLQEKFRPAIFKFDQIVANTNKLSKSSSEFSKQDHFFTENVKNIFVLVTEFAVVLTYTTLLLLKFQSFRHFNVK